MATEISVMLAVSDGNAAIDFYKTAFGAVLLWHLNGGGHVVAGLAIDGAKFFLATESPPEGTRGPASAGFTTVRIELFVDDPVTVQKRAITEFCSSVIPTLTEEQLSTPHNSPDGHLLGREILLAMYIHVAHHRGQAEIYLRDNGIKPPPYKI